MKEVIFVPCHTSDKSGDPIVIELSESLWNLVERCSFYLFIYFRISLFESLALLSPSVNSVAILC